jgi:5-methylcytosine-specific restriction endonuclease McrA
MATATRNQVNLDALIPRADFFEVTDTVIADTGVIRISDLKPCPVFDMLRKPDFQRETDSWSPKQVAKLIETYSKSDIIPSIILWQNGNKIFIVDGAHRLSALVAWVRNDYGDGELSRKLFSRIPDHQKALDEETRRLVDELAGPWAQHERTGSMLNMKDVQVQWLKSPRADQAADAFIRINQGGTVIDPLEARILRSKRSALSIATRIISRGGTGHEYWKHFSDAGARDRAPSLGKEIYKLLFSPTLEMPIKTMDIPLAGFGYGAGALRFAFDLVGLTNELPVPDSTKGKGTDAPLPDDLVGVATVEYLIKARRAIRLILSNEKLSLGLHPALYFYTAGGAFQPAALHNAIAWLLNLERRGKIQDFLNVRGLFEELALTHPAVIKPAAHLLGSGARTRSKMLALFDRTLAILIATPDPIAAWKKLVREFPHLAEDEREQKQEATKGKSGGKFNRGAKNAAALSELSHVSKCEICGGLLHKNGKVVDHKQARSSGGRSSSANARWVHPACNSNREKNEQNKRK